MANWSQRFSLTETGVRSYAPRNAGVYCLWVHLTNGDWRLFYVGKADDLSARLVQHMGASEPNTGIRKHCAEHVCAFSYAAVSHAGDRDVLEKAVYDHHHPECNRCAPVG